MLFIVCFIDLLHSRFAFTKVNLLHLRVTRKVREIIFFIKKLDLKKASIFYVKQIPESYECKTAEKLILYPK